MYVLLNLFCDVCGWISRSHPVSGRKKNKNGINKGIFVTADSVQSFQSWVSVQLAWLYRLLGFISRLCYKVFTGLFHMFNISAMVHLELEILSLVGSNHLTEVWKLEVHQLEQLSVCGGKV